MNDRSHIVVPTHARRARKLAAALCVACLLAARPAYADIFLTPWIGGNGGAPTGASLVDVGGAIGVTAGNLVDFDFDLGYSPDFYGSRVSSSLVSAITDVTIGIPIGHRDRLQLRPYVTGGLGVVLSRNDDIGAAFGGGVTVFTNSHLGVRADVRTIQSLHDSSGRVSFWRTSIGVVIR